MRCFWKWPYLKFLGKLICSIIWEICLKYDFRWRTWENSPVSVLLVVIYMIFWSSSHKMNREKFFWFILQSCHNHWINDGVSKICYGFKICAFFHKILTGGLSLVRKFYSWKSKIYGHDSWTWEFSLVSNKEDIEHSCFIFLFRITVLKFFILHNINMEFSSLWPIYPQNFRSADFCLYTDFTLIKLKPTAITSKHGKIPLF